MFSIGVASKFLGISPKTLRRWEIKGMINPSKTVGGHRRYSFSQLYNLRRNKNLEVSNNSLNRVGVIYARVSTHIQKKRGDLQRQIDTIKDSCDKANISIKRIYNDTGSGLNMNRRGLWSMI